MPDRAACHRDGMRGGGLAIEAISLDRRGKRAVDGVSFTLNEGETLGVAIFNHPPSFRHPTSWHARTYGLFTANCFGSLDKSARR